MAPTYEVIFLGVLPRINPANGSCDAEKASVLMGITVGGSTAPLWQNAQKCPPGLTDFTCGVMDGHKQKDTASDEALSVGVGPDQRFDALAVYNATLTYSDGTTTTVTAVVAQDTSGNTYLTPQLTHYADLAKLAVKPIEALTFDSVTRTGPSIDAGNGSANLTPPLGGARSGMITDGINSSAGGIDADILALSALIWDDQGTILIGSDTTPFADMEAYAAPVVADNTSAPRATDGTDTHDGEWHSALLFGGTENGFLDSGDGGWADTLFGQESNDTLTGGHGNDSILGDLKADVLFAGYDRNPVVAGNDTGQIAGNGTKNPRLGTYFVTNSDGHGNSYAEIEKIINGTPSDIRIDDTGSNLFQSRNGNDSVYGGSGTIYTKEVVGLLEIEKGSGGTNATICLNNADRGDKATEGAAHYDRVAANSGNETGGSRAGAITDFILGNSGGFGDGDTANNNFVDLPSFYDTLAKWRADFDANGVVNQPNSADNASTVDYFDKGTVDGHTNRAFNMVARSLSTARNTARWPWAWDTHLDPTRTDPGPAPRGQ